MGRMVITIATVALLWMASPTATAQTPRQPQPSTGVASGSSAASSTGGGAASPVSSVGVPLWRGLISGMDANAVALQLQKLPEVQQAEVRQKKNKPPEIKIKYFPEGVALFGFKMNLRFKFETSGLEQVYLVSEPVCGDAGFQTRVKSLAAGLGEKYPRAIKVLGTDGAKSENEFAVTDEVTLVLVGLRSAAPPSAYEVAKANLEASLAKARNSYGGMSESYSALLLKFARENALRACPGTEGVMGSVTLAYSSYAKTRAQQDSSRAWEAEQNRRDKDKL